VAWLALAVAWPAAGAYAQRVTAQIQGKVLEAPGRPSPGARVVATNLSTAAATPVIADAAGGYVIPALTPGQYVLNVTGAGGAATTEFVDVGIGQTVDVDIDISAIGQRGDETIEVRAAGNENRTSEVATNVSREQIANLPQNSRNFLNFARLAPGMRPPLDENAQKVSSGGMDAPAINVFVDGVSLKNNILDGGVVGQDASRGNPFPQLAVAGFRVLTQNYKAEYEQAGSAVISTVTRSGGNDVHAEVFSSFQSKAMVANDPFTRERGEPKPEYARYQFGGLASGPLITNKLFALFTYEGNYQNRANQVALGNPTEANVERFGKYEGSFTSPFREHLGFGKISWVPSSRQTVDLSLSLRRETDVRSFGGTTSLEAAENVRNNVLTGALRHQWRLPSDLVNEATAQLLLFQWNPGAENPSVPGEDFAGVVRIGGRDSDQDIRQRAITLRDDVSLPVLDAAGSHQVKIGGKLALQHYDVNKSLFGNPLFHYKVDPALNLDFDAPFEAQFGVGEPKMSSNNSQIGVYAQDDWRVNDHLALNLGVRWDVETDPLNNDYRTPDAVRAAVTELAPMIAEANGADFFHPDNYLTDGTKRSIYLGEIQPRIGVSYDIMGDQQTVVFGGAGRYFDRTLYNTGLDELYRLQYNVRTFRFSRDGAAREGQPTIMWDPSYLSRDGLQGLIDRGEAPAPEIFLLENDTKPPHSDQYSFGVRQVVGEFNLSATFSHIRSENGLGFYPANREVSGDRNYLPVPGGFGRVNVSGDDIATRFTGVYVSAERPYRDDSPWSVSAMYTLAWSKVRGDLFSSYDLSSAPTIKETPFTPGNNDERHRLVMSGILGLPAGYKVATFIQLGSGLPYTIDDNSRGTTFGLRRFLRNGGRADDFLQFSQVDARVIKDFRIGGQHATLTAEVFNLFNSYNYGDYDGFKPAGDTPNPSFGKPRRIISPPRSFQVGVSYGF
jgi:hypothetical protein